MTLSQLYRKARTALADGGIENSGYDAMCLLEHYFGADRAGLAVSGNVQPDDALTADFLAAAEKRLSGYPLQYILGKWTFMDIPLFVGEGVLIPRDDTEVLVREAIKRIKTLKNPKPKIIDLCSGSGAAAIALAKAYPESEVYAVELSDPAFAYLEKNTAYNKCENVKLIKGDIFELHSLFPDGSLDVLVSNPPYVKSSVIDTLSREVRCEPRLALDGGEDGLCFYKAIAEHWLCKVKKGGFAGVEIGEDLGGEVSALFRRHGLESISVLKDMSGLDRAVFGG